MENEPITPSGEEVKWERLNQNSARVIQALLDDIGMSSVDREPDEAQNVQKGVIEALSFITNGYSGSYETIPNRQLARELRECAVIQVVDNGNEPIAKELRAMASIMDIIARPRRKK